MPAAAHGRQQQHTTIIAISWFERTLPLSSHLRGSAQNGFHLRRGGCRQVFRRPRAAAERPRGEFAALFEDVMANASFRSVVLQRREGQPGCHCLGARGHLALGILLSRNAVRTLARRVGTTRTDGTRFQTCSPPREVLCAGSRSLIAPSAQGQGLVTGWHAAADGHTEPPR